MKITHKNMEGVLTWPESKSSFPWNVNLVKNHHRLAFTLLSGPQGGAPAEDSPMLKSVRVKVSVLRVIRMSSIYSLFVWPYL